MQTLSLFLERDSLHGNEVLVAFQSRPNPEPIPRARLVAIVAKANGRCLRLSNTETLSLNLSLEGDSFKAMMGLANVLLIL